MLVPRWNLESDRSHAKFARLLPGVCLMKLLVTGASGFVGSAVMRRARELGWEVLGVGRRSLNEPDYVSVDLSRPFELDFHPDVVVHAAALSSPWGKRRDYESQNVGVTRHVLNYCATHGRPHLLYISTAAVLYRNEHQLAMNEQTPVPAIPINEYARTKYLGELLTRGYAGNWAILRPRAVFGPGDTVVFPRILRALKKGRLPLIESDRPVIGDLIYIDTLVEYILRAAEKRATGLYHLTNGEPVEIYEFLGKISAALDLPLPARKMSARQAMRLARIVEAVYRSLPFLGEPPLTTFGISVFTYCKTFDVSRTVRDLGLPAVTVNNGLEKFIAWQLAETKRSASSLSRL
jgi:nucleoside-diphosphate-sugar epimerase